MKPTFPTITIPHRREAFGSGKCRTRRSPVTDYNYHSVAFEGSSAPYVHTRARSFWNIISDYSKKEARHNFWG